MPSEAPGVTNESLYTDSTMALDPDTGKPAWHFQDQNNDQWDFDWAFERQLIKLPLFGQSRTVFVTVVRVMDRELPSRTGRRHAVNAGDPG